MNRLSTIALALATLGLTAACAVPTASPKLPVVLVHGAWSEARVWDRVAADLRARGHAVTAVELPGHGKDATPASSLSLAAYVQAVIRRPTRPRASPGKA